MTDKSRIPNHLIDESSPYLQQHAYNPVDWYPWGDEALAKAKHENKLIFLSIGYSTCHWCHVMAHESFEDEEVAELLNDRFVCIKVDREERKDLDAIYMKACQVMTGTGGWPLNIWLTPDRLPVYAGTYFSKRSHMTRVGLMETAEYLSDTFEKNPDSLFSRSVEVTDRLIQMEDYKEGELDRKIVWETVQDLVQAYDPIYGGFSKAPKFPSPQQLLFLLESKDTARHQDALHTLEQMAKGGIYDHIGGGFSRYSVDEKWLIPHFEKMLYDNGLLLDAYAKAYQLTKREDFLRVINETVGFLEDEMTHPEGGFYSAYDADSEGVEGKYYCFTLDEVEQVLGAERAKTFSKFYNITQHGNFEGYNIPNLIQHSLDKNLDPELTRMRSELAVYRSKRIKPGLDDKVLSLGNGFAIHGLASVFEVTEDDKVLQMASRAYGYVKDCLISEDDTLLTGVRDGQGEVEGVLEDYAAIIRAVLKLYEVTYDDAYLIDAMRLTRRTVELFFDEDLGGFFIGSKNSEDLIYNPKESTMERHQAATP